MRLQVIWALRGSKCLGKTSRDEKASLKQAIAWLMVLSVSWFKKTSISADSNLIIQWF